MSGADGPREGIHDRRALAGKRQLDSSRDVVILRAALEGLAERGYDRLTMDDVAARAHAGKGALYRRWSTKAELVTAAIAAWRAELGELSLPDTGSLRSDIELLVASVPEFQEATRRQIAVLAGLATAASRDPELAAALSKNVLAPPRQAIQEILERAVARGEIPPDKDLGLLPDTFIGLNVIRLVTGQKVDAAFVRRVFEQIVLPLATGQL